MARRWADPSAFRPSPGAAAASRPTWRQSISLIVALVVVAGVVSAVSYLVRPDRARSFDLLHGSVLIGDQFGPVSVDLGSGKGTLQIRGADDLADVRTPGNLQLVGLDGGTLLLNRGNGTFNMIDSTGFVVKRNGGVPIAGGGGDTTATGVAAGQLGYIERSGTAGTDVVLVSPATVSSAAANPSAKVRPRAIYASTDLGDTADGGSASVNGDLWSLFKRKSDGATVLRRLVLPADSSTGVTLKASDHGVVNALSSLESASASATGGDVLGVASPGRVRLIAPDLSSTTVSYRSPAGLDTIVATTGSQDRLSWLLHGSDGWSVLSVAADGRDRVGPVALRTIPPDAQLAPAAESLGALYTMLRSGDAGTIYRVGFDGRVTAVEAEYPQKMGPDGKSLESASFSDGYLVARGSRVVVDSPGHYLALTVFTDGSHAPRIIEKSNLTSVNAANGADALTRGPVTDKPQTTPTQGKQAKQAVAPQINNKINCKQVNQKPHVPRIASTDPSARSVGLSWVYPIISSQDCNPSTYVVSVKLLSNDAPPAPGSVTLQDHTDTVISGLFPSTRYEFTVTAYINGQGTPSLPVLVTTGKEGPAAPTGVSVSADASGNWDLSWNGCGSVANKCVPTDSWTVQPSFCDNRGLSASPAQLIAPADPSSVRQPPAVYKGSDALLGRSLRFTVQGTGIDGTAGDVSATSACVQSWTSPTVSAMTLTASHTSDTSSNASVNLDLGADPTRNAGGVGATVTFMLEGAGHTQSKTVTYSGDRTLAAAFSGLQPGYEYSATATVSPPGHPGSAQTTGSKQLTTRSDWPTLSVSATCPSDGGFHVNCPLSVSLSGLASSDAHDERFNLTDDSGLYCGGGNDTYLFNQNGAPTSFDPATFKYTSQISLIPVLGGYSGSCTVRVALVEAPGTSQPEYFGGTTSGAATGTVDLGSASTLGASSNDFTVAWTTGGGSATVTYNGSYSDDQVNSLSTNWNMVLSAPNGTNCGSTNNPPRHEGTSVPLSTDCLNSYGDQTSGWQVSISYTEQANSKNVNVGAKAVSGAPPGYVPPCTLDTGGDNFSASWNTDATAPAVTVGFTQGSSDLRGCSNLKYEIIEDGGLLGTKDCSDVTPAGALPDTAPGDVTMALSSSCVADITATLTPNWRVKITWDSQRPGNTGAEIAMSNDPPHN